MSRDVASSERYSLYLLRHEASPAFVIGLHISLFNRSTSAPSPFSPSTVWWLIFLANPDRPAHCYYTGWVDEVVWKLLVNRRESWPEPNSCWKPKLLASLCLSVCQCNSALDHMASPNWQAFNIACRTVLNFLQLKCLPNRARVWQARRKVLIRSRSRIFYVTQISLDDRSSRPNWPKVWLPPHLNGSDDLLAVCQDEGLKSITDRQTTSVVMMMMKVARLM